jgi:hypothetical protein
VKVVRNKKARALDLDRFLSRPLIAHLATQSPEGARESPLWYLWEDGAIWLIAEDSWNTFHGRVERDPRVAVGFVDFNPQTGLFHHVGLRGKASVEPWDDGRGARLVRRYLRHLPSYVEPAKAPRAGRVSGKHPMYFVRVVPETVVVRDQSYRSRAGQPGGMEQRPDAYDP